MKQTYSVLPVLTKCKVEQWEAEISGRDRKTGRCVTAPAQSQEVVRTFGCVAKIDRTHVCLTTCCLAKSGSRLQVFGGAR